MNIPWNQPAFAWLPSHMKWYSITHKLLWATKAVHAQQRKWYCRVWHSRIALALFRCFEKIISTLPQTAPKGTHVRIPFSVCSRMKKQESTENEIYCWFNYWPNAIFSNLKCWSKKKPTWHFFAGFVDRLQLELRSHLFIRSSDHVGDMFQGQICRSWESSQPGLPGPGLAHHWFQELTICVGCNML